MMYSDDIISWDNIKTTKPLGYFDEEISYRYHQSILKKYFENIRFDNMEDIIHAVTLINGFYSTQMGQRWCFLVAKEIFEISKKNRL